MYLDPRVLSLVRGINYGGCRASIFYFFICLLFRDIFYWLNPLSLFFLYCSNIRECQLGIILH